MSSKYTVENIKHFKKAHKNIYKSHVKGLNWINKQSTKSIFPPLDYFLAQLRMFRDFLVLEGPENLKVEENSVVASVQSALLAYNDYETKVEEYNGYMIEHRDNLDEAEVERLQKEFSTLWIEFWKIVAVDYQLWEEIMYDINI